MMPPITGLVAAPFTPMNADGAVNLELIDTYAEFLASNGVIGAFVCGTTGQGTSLTVPERMAVAQRWSNVIGDDFRLIVHVGHASITVSRELAAHAQQIGADAIATVPPMFYQTTDIDVLVEYCGEVASAAPELAFYYYHIPTRSMICISVHDFLAMGGERIPTLSGAKFTYEDLMDFGRCLDLDGGRYNMLFGRDEMLLGALAVGATGAVGTTYNFAAPLNRGIMDAFAAGDLAEARRLQGCAREMIAILFQYGFGSFIAIMKMVGLDCGPPRLPLRELAADDCTKLRAQLEQVGFFEFCSKV